MSLIRVTHVELKSLSLHEKFGVCESFWSKHRNPEVERVEEWPTLRSRLQRDFVNNLHTSGIILRTLHGFLAHEKTPAPLGPYSSPMPWALWWSGLGWGQIRPNRHSRGAECTLGSGGGLGIFECSVVVRVAHHTLLARTAHT